jgi:hypothetical protein
MGPRLGTVIEYAVVLAWEFREKCTSLGNIIGVKCVIIHHDRA